MKDILQDIVANKQKEVARQKQAIPLQTLFAMSEAYKGKPIRSMRASLAASSSGIIAEFKRKSPSKGWLYSNAEIEKIVPLYEKGGASACSILTDIDFFGGSLSDLKQARSLVQLPLLRKDFIIDEYQLYQALVMGADAILLIAACLSPEQCYAFAELAHNIGLEVLLEIHSEEELNHLNPFVDMLGVNNRNLGTFHTDVENSFRLAKALQAITQEKGLSPLLVSESGISEIGTVSRLREVGFRGFLIGETFMKTKQPGDTLAQFIGGLS